MSPVEADLLDAKVRLSGLTKQDYIIRRLLEKEIVVMGNPKVYKALKYELAAILHELQRIEAGADLSDELLEIIRLIAEIMEGMKGGEM